MEKHPNTPFTSQGAWESKSKASRRLMDSGYREVLVERLVTMNQSEERRAAVSLDAKARWAYGSQRATVTHWHKLNRQASIDSAAHARSFVRDTSMSAARAKLSKTSKLHLKFKSMLTCASITGFTTEGRVGPFEVDEANFDLKIAVEVDGCYWHGCATCGFPGVPSTVRNDKSKDAYLRASGWTIVRVPGHTITRDPEASLDVVRQSLNTVRGYAR